MQDIIFFIFIKKFDTQNYELMKLYALINNFIYTYVYIYPNKF